MTENNTPVFNVQVSMQFRVPKVGSYDWDNYAVVAYQAGDITPDEADSIDAAWAVVEAMARDYLVRGDSCTASTYLMGNDINMAAPRQVGTIQVTEHDSPTGQMVEERFVPTPAVVNPTNEEIQAAIDGDGPWY